MLVRAGTGVGEGGTVGPLETWGYVGTSQSWALSLGLRGVMGAERTWEGACRGAWEKRWGLGGMEVRG